MKPYKVEKLPLDYKVDKELLRLLAEANSKYGEYKSLINTLEFDSKYFLDSILLNDSYKSTQIEGTQISQDEMYYLNYIEKNDDNLEIQNLKKTIEYAREEIKEKPISMNLVNEMHKILLNSVRGSEKEPGSVRTMQNWIGMRGVGIEGAIFIPPAPEDVVESLLNLYEYMNDAFTDPLLITVAIAHAQFETIHPYKDGNGRLGRALIPIQMALLDEAEPILYLSEVIELYKPSYQRNLMESRRGNISGFIKFFLQCVIDQCVVNINKLERIKYVYREDMMKIEVIKGSSIYKIMPIILRQVVFTKKEIIESTGVSSSTVSNLLSKLIELEIVVKDESVIKSGYRYERIYEIFVGSKEYY